MVHMERQSAQFKNNENLNLLDKHTNWNAALPLSVDEFLVNDADLSKYKEFIGCINEFTDIYRKITVDKRKKPPYSWARLVQEFCLYYFIAQKVYGYHLEAMNQVLFNEKFHELIMNVLNLIKNEGDGTFDQKALDAANKELIDYLTSLSPSTMTVGLGLLPMLGFSLACIIVAATVPMQPIFISLLIFAAIVGAIFTGLFINACSSGRQRKHEIERTYVPLKSGLDLFATFFKENPLPKETDSTMPSLEEADSSATPNYP